MLCSKISYNSFKDAQTHLNHIRRPKFWKGKRRNKSHKKPVRSYYCNECEKWHLTSKK